MNRAANNVIDAPALPLIIKDESQRWRNHAMTWRPAHDGGFDQRRYDVVAIDQAAARQFVQQHHYSASYPAGNHRFGLIDRAANQPLVGVAVFGNPAGPRVLSSAFPTLVPYVQSTELSRFVLLDDVPSNGETWFLGRTFKHLREREIKGVISFSDPTARTDLDGNVIFPGHIGGIYIASNAAYTGTSGRNTAILLGDGTILHARARSKVANGERGSAGVERRLVEHGARPRRKDEDPRLWFNAALSDINARLYTSPGNHRYCFAIGSPSERRQLLTELGHARLEPPTQQLFIPPRFIDVAPSPQPLAVPTLARHGDMQSLFG